MTTPTREDIARLEKRLVSMEKQITDLITALFPKATVADELMMVEVQGGSKVEHLRKKFKREKRK